MVVVDNSSDLPPTPCTVRLYSVPVAADLIGGMSERYVWQLIADGVLRKVVQGRRTMVRDDDLARYIDEHTEGGVA